jgi:hypothetical protein
MNSRVQRDSQLLTPLVTLGPHGTRNRWSSAGTGSQHRRISIAGQGASHRHDLGRRSSPALGSNPTSSASQRGH